jgi:hypothetical protein
MHARTSSIGKIQSIDYQKRLPAEFTLTSNDFSAGKMVLTMGRNNSTSDICIQATEVFGTLHTSTDEGLGCQIPGSAPAVLGCKRPGDDPSSQSLHRAIQSFLFRWLRLILHFNYPIWSEDEDIFNEHWCAARRAMLKVIKRASYRSILGTDAFWLDSYFCWDLRVRRARQY